ncbi:hypothetical protein M2451_003692 [Dysgonomonas sp. PFB1-18]|uniref:hypothetical protein n=1 Tax=unclassified Dysgonomonas TaxID=2630389 RepID=UPI0024753511|nr:MULTISPECIES: hypothetical protein [unclassified Dysgonomonas]MDH6310881.1 hypothetical protein [Dysgonomonas sp. PF1-14]MDH6340681.1 hypothetical protein [Dysgonomonas sp. PF1-16]MDH6382351.1 hypothetical protein [Dysgonomonas sp. PFB1-18]MDH6399701.1 hypothetical protein [Dysgonomonas sp. PF1-23]
MKHIYFLFLLYLFALSGYSQHIGGTHSSQSFDLKYGELEIYLKSGEVLKGKYRIKGTDTGDLNLDYRSIDSIKIVSDTEVLGRNTKSKTFCYVNIKGKPRLLRIIYQSPRLSFYEGRPIASSKTGILYSSKVYMKKDDADAVEYQTKANGSHIKKYFPGCQALLDFQKDKENRHLVQDFGVLMRIYNNDCKLSTEGLNLKFR